MLLALPAVVGVPLALVVRHMASRDLHRMGDGRLDPRGRAETYAAFVRAENALALGIAAPFASLGLWMTCLRLLTLFE
jgi:hypothetical protein